MVPLSSSCTHIDNSDRELVKQIHENPYYQYLVGISSFQQSFRMILLKFNSKMGAD
ncbi:MAG: transposase [Clostridiales bacterium]|nr:transposase [Clostridiales bacterium]